MMPAEDYRAIALRADRLKVTGNRRSKKQSRSTR